MCGIIGFLTNENYKGALSRETYISQALVVDTLRGEDSTGIFYQTHENSKAPSGYSKAVRDGYSFVNSPNYEAAMKQAQKMRFCIGHNRAATMGSVDTESAHPFREETVTGCHNGTIHGGLNGLPISLAESKAGLDSRCIMMNLAASAPEDARKDILSKLDGAFMLVWHDSRDGSLNFARNNTRTFHIAQSYDQETLFFASEAGTLQWLNQRIGLGTIDVTYLEPGHHMKFFEGSLEPEVQEFDLAPKYVAPIKGYGGYANGSWYSGNNYKGNSKSPKSWPSRGGNKIKVGGSLREVPAPLVLGLADAMLSPDDRIQFTPMTVQPEAKVTPLGPRYVTGYLNSLGLNAIVFGVERHVAVNGFDRQWEVRPLGVKQVKAQDGFTPIVVCHLVTPYQLSGAETLTLRLPSPKSSTDIYPTENPGDGDVRGPNGQLYSVEDWLKLTIGGCVQCNGALLMQEADMINWEGDEPTCGICDEDAWTAAGLYDNQWMH